MKIEQIQDIVNREDAISHPDRPYRDQRGSWDVIADDGGHTIHAKLATAVTIEALGIPIEATPTQEYLETLRRWRAEGIGTD
jgi:hypothetical protein